MKKAASVAFLGLAQFGADFLTLHTPLTDGTRNIINAENLAKMKKGAYLINCARGELLVEEDVKAALESGQLAGAAVDVFAVEPARESILFGLPNVVATPHLGASTAEAQENVALQVAEQMADFLIDGAVSNALNMASVTAEEAPRLKPYFELARVLGSFAGQLTETGLKEVHIEYEGHVATLNTRPLTSILLEGLLRPLSENVNMVNAPFVAQQRDIDVKETRDEAPGDYQTHIKLTVTTERQTRSVCGTLFADSRPRIVQVKGIKLEAEASPHMLYITNEDKPGFIGALGTTLGKHGVNIATFHLGRSAPGGDAIALLEIDQALSPEALAEVEALEHVGQAKPLSF